MRSKVPTIRRANMNSKQNNSVLIYGPGQVEGVSMISSATKIQPKLGDLLLFRSNTKQR